jgi:hypothetical protein
MKCEKSVEPSFDVARTGNQVDAEAIQTGQPKRKGLERGVKGLDYRSRNAQIQERKGCSFAMQM